VATLFSCTEDVGDAGTLLVVEKLWRSQSSDDNDDDNDSVFVGSISYRITICVFVISGTDRSDYWRDNKDKQ